LHLRYSFVQGYQVKKWGGGKGVGSSSFKKDKILKNEQMVKRVKPTKKLLELKIKTNLKNNTKSFILPTNKLK